MWTETKLRSIKTHKENEANIRSIRYLLNDFPCLHVALCFYFCVFQFLFQNVSLKLINNFVFFVFILISFIHFLISCSIMTEKFQIIFLQSQKYILREKTLVNPLGLCQNFIGGIKWAFLRGLNSLIFHQSTCSFHVKLKLHPLCFELLNFPF